MTRKGAQDEDSVAAQGVRRAESGDGSRPASQRGPHMRAGGVGDAGSQTSAQRGPRAGTGPYERARLVAVRAWAAVGCAVVFLIALRGLASVGSAVECLFVALLVGFMCSPITNWLERRGVARALGALLALLLVIACAAGLVVWIVPLFVGQLQQLLDRVPAFIDQAQRSVRVLWETYGSNASADTQATVQQVVQTLATKGTELASELATTLSSGIVPNLMGFANGLVMFFLGLVMAFWFAKDYPTIMRELGVIAGPRHDDALALLVAVVSRSVGGYMRGMAITSLINGVVAFVGFALVGNAYAGLMAALVGIMHFVPVVGPVVSTAVAVAVALFSSPADAFWTLAVAVLAQNVADNLLGPIVMRSAVKIHPAMSLIGITVGASLGGAVGMTLAIPVTAAIKGVFIYYFETRTARQLVSFDGAFFQGTPFHHADGRPVPSFDALDDDKFLAQSRLVSYDGVDDVEADAPPEVDQHHLSDVLRRQLEEFKRLRK